MSQSFGVMFHHFHDDAHPRSQGSLCSGGLRELLEFLGPERILPADEWIRRACHGVLSGEICLTFDDNLRCQYDVALPVLESYGLTAAWFVATSTLDHTALPRLEIYHLFRSRCFEEIDAFYAAFFHLLAGSEHAETTEAALSAFQPGSYLAEFPFYSEADRRFRYVRDVVLGPRHYCALMDEMLAQYGLTPAKLARGLWMDAACLRRLHDSGHVIGLHSHSHPTRLAELPESEQRREYFVNHAELSRVTGVPPTTMSHPCNSFDARTLGILRELGVRAGFCSHRAATADDLLTLPREDHANLVQEMRRCASHC